MRLQASSSLAVALALLFACSKDPAAPGAPGAGDSGGPGGSGPGGTHAGSGGSTGGGGTGGTAGPPGGTAGAGNVAYDASAVRACGIDAGANPCLECLAVTCCDAAQTCFDDPTCAAAFGPYQECIRTTPDDPSMCYGNFSRAILVNTRVHEKLLTCIGFTNNGCQVCGAPAAL